MILVYITCKDKAQARSIGKALLEKKLVACVNIFPIESMYFWDGRLQKDSEYVLLCKTKDKSYKKLCSSVRKLHSYKTPCIIRIKADANKDYLKWLDKEVR